MTSAAKATGASAPAAVLTACIGGDGDERLGERYVDPGSGVIRLVMYLGRRLKVYRLVDAQDMPPHDGIAYYEVVIMFGNGDADVIPVTVTVWGACAHEGTMCSPVAGDCLCECQRCTERVRS